MVKKVSHTTRRNPRRHQRQAASKFNNRGFLVWIALLVNPLVFMAWAAVKVYKKASFDAYSAMGSGALRARTPSLNVQDAQIAKGEVSRLSQYYPQLKSAPLQVQRSETKRPKRTNPPTASPAEKIYSDAFQKHFEKMDSPWEDWEECDPQADFEARCHPRPATCRVVSDSITNKHGIGNALVVSLVKAAKELLAENPDCAPVISYGHLLDYVLEPQVAIQNIEDRKCIIYSITQPKEAVANKVAAITSRYNQLQNQQGEINIAILQKQLPLVAIQIRTGWGDEKHRNMRAWDALGGCSEYKEQFKNMHHKAVSEVNVQEMILDTALAADRAFGKKQWRAYIASDAPGIRHYAKHILEARVATEHIQWVDGKIGHNTRPGASTTAEGEADISVNALVDIIMMSSANMLVSINSKFPRAANMRSMCTQRYAELRGHPRHGLATAGSILTKSYSRKSSTGTDDSHWIPDLTEEEKERFFATLPDGDQNLCTRANDPVRACFCFKKLSHF